MRVPLQPFWFKLCKCSLMNLSGPQVVGDRPAPICALCERADIPAGRLGLTTLPRAGTLFQACRVCWYSTHVRELTTGGDVSNETIAHVEHVLAQAYSRLRAELEAVYTGAPPPP